MLCLFCDEETAEVTEMQHTRRHFLCVACRLVFGVEFDGTLTAIQPSWA